jgi:hypothetical protein
MAADGAQRVHRRRIDSDARERNDAMAGTVTMGSIAGRTSASPAPGMKSKDCSQQS